MLFSSVVLALVLSTAGAPPPEVVGLPLPAPYTVSRTSRNAQFMVIVAQTTRPEASLLLVRDVRTGRTLWKRYVGGKLTVNPLRAQQQNLYAWATVQGGHWEYVFSLHSGKIMNQIEVRHVVPDTP